MQNVWILAQTDGNQAPARISSEPVTSQGQQGTGTIQEPNGGTPQGRQPASPWGAGGQLLFLVVIMVVFFMLMVRGPRKQQREQKQMLQSLKKNDRVRTIGGILGTVMDVRDDEVVLKVDEANNTKIHVSVSAIGKNLSAEEKS